MYVQWNTVDLPPPPFQTPKIKERRKADRLVQIHLDRQPSRQPTDMDGTLRPEDGVEPTEQNCWNNLFVHLTINISLPRPPRSRVDSSSVVGTSDRRTVTVLLELLEDCLVTGSSPVKIPCRRNAGPCFASCT